MTKSRGNILAPISSKNLFFSVHHRIGIILVDDDDRWSEKNKIKYAKKQIRRIEHYNGMGAIILDERTWNGLKAYEKALIFYTKIVNMLDFHRRNKLKQLATDF